jgi:hypothetical protein
MAINKNHEFEELDGVKCGIVERNMSPERVDFLKKLLEFNKFKVVVVSSPPGKTATAPAAKIVEGEEAPAPVEPVPVITPETFTVGVTDYTFNTINAIFGRLLKTPEGHVVTMAYWQQKENVSHDEVPYYEMSHNKS